MILGVSYCRPAVGVTPPSLIGRVVQNQDFTPNDISLSMGKTAQVITRQSTISLLPLFI